jgi:23S rRNA (adenine2503-C2)-methyltransferase
MSHTKKTFLLGLDYHQLTELVGRFEQSPYRARQIFDALYRQRVSALAEISTLPLGFRGILEENGFETGIPEIQKKFASVDGTVRYLIGFEDGQSVESVWMPTGDGGEEENVEAGESGSTSGWDRATICISSQVGCAVDCQFCLTAALGMKRNLTAGEIVGQVIAVLRDQQVEPPNQRVNLVFMGMGEPLLNYQNFMQSVRLLVEGVGIPESRMTVSTAGIVPRIEELGKEPVRPRIAISLNASNDALRTQIMPINRKWNLAALLDAARAFPLRKREKMTFEYVLLAEVNDGEEHAREVVGLLNGMRARVNLIALNPGPGIEFRTPSEERVRRFQQILMASGIPTFIRRPRGRDIYAACGQLKRTVELTSIGA